MRTTRGRGAITGTDSHGGRRHGFTMMELSIVLVVVGLIMAAGTAAWYSILEGRRVSKTAAVLNEVKSCLIKRIMLTERYPTYTGYDTAGYNDNTDCDNPALYDSTRDVDLCLCGKVDAWGGSLYYLEGLDDGGDSLADAASPYLLEDDIKGTTRTLPGSGSTIEDKNGESIGNIAFVLISLGKNRVADHTSYDDFENGYQAGPIGEITDATVNFDPDDHDVVVEYVDDVILYVTANEIIATVSQ